MLRWPLDAIAGAHEATPAAVRAACKLFGQAVFGNYAYFDGRPGKDFCDEVVRIHEMNVAAAARKRNAAV